MKTLVRRYAVPAVLLATGFTAGVLYQDHAAVQADIRKGPAREAFQSGGERSETQLKEISATLLRIEKKIADVERTMNGGNVNSRK